MIGPMFVDYSACDQCKNIDSMGICLKCGACGRKFGDFGIMIDDGGTTVSYDEDEQ